MGHGGVPGLKGVCDRKGWPFPAGLVAAPAKGVGGLGYCLRGQPAHHPPRAGVPVLVGSRHLSSEPPRLVSVWPLVQTLWFGSSEVGGIKGNKSRSGQSCRAGRKWPPAPASGADQLLQRSPCRPGRTTVSRHLGYALQARHPLRRFVTKAGSEFEQEPHSAVGSRQGASRSPSLTWEERAALGLPALQGPAVANARGQREGSAPVCSAVPPPPLP